MDAIPLRVATLNAWALPPPIGHQVPGRIEQLGAALPPLHLDVVALQEVWRRDARHLLVEAGRRSGLLHHWHRPRALGGSGLLVLSRWPILDAAFEAYLLGGPPHLTQLDYFAGKGFARLRIAGPDGPFTLINTHLQARYGRRVAHGYVGHRAGQIVQLAKTMRAERDPVLLVGDFNMREDHTGYGILRALTGVRDLSRERGRAEATVLPENPYRNHDKPRRVDYVFARDGAAARWEPLAARRAFDGLFTLGGEPATYSNHAGVIADVALVPGSGVVAPRVDPQALAAARRALRDGRERAARRRGSHRGGAAAAIGGAAMIAAGVRAPAIGRRGFLRSALQGAAFALTAPAAGLAVVSELVVPEELRAFDILEYELARLERVEPLERPSRDALRAVSAP